MRLLLAAFCLTLAAQSPEAQVKDVVRRYVAARELRDEKAIEALFTPDADQLVSSGEWRRGRAALVKGTLASSGANPGHRTIEVETVRFLTPAVALADGRYEIAGAAGSPARRMNATFLIVQENGRWLIAAIRNMLPAR